MFTTGILMPRSTMYPSIGPDFMTGLRESLKQQGLDGEVHFVMDNISFGTNQGEIYAKAEKMIMLENPDVVVVFAGNEVATTLQPLFNACSKVLLVVNFGENIPQPVAKNPDVIFHTLNFTLLTRLTGKLAATDAGKQTANLLSFYDGGYDLSFSFVDSNQKNGGVTAYNYITQQQPEHFSLDPLLQFLKENPTVRTLLCAFSGEDAVKFYREIGPAEKYGDCKVYVSPMMLDEFLKLNVKEDLRVKNAQGYIPWHSSLQNEANKQFLESCTAINKRSVNYFSLLGWEAGLLLGECSLLANSGIKDPEAIIEHLKQSEFDSPRGPMRMDENTNHFFTTCYLAVADGNLEITIKETVENITEEWQAFTSEMAGAAYSSGWKNTYLCI